MARWQVALDEEPALANEVQQVFDAHGHKTIATLRADGSPRLSGVECQFRSGELVLGMMPGSRKARDLQRDPRMEIHSASVDSPSDDPRAWPGDAKISGRAIEITAPEEREPISDDPSATHHIFRVEIDRIVRIKLDGDPLHLLVRTWHPGRPIEEVFAD